MVFLKDLNNPVVESNITTEARLYIIVFWRYSKTCLKQPLTKIQKMVFGLEDQLSLNASLKYCRMFKREHSQNFRPSLSHHLSLKNSLFVYF